MKDRFQTHFGTSFDTFMDDEHDMAKAAEDLASAGTSASGDKGREEMKGDGVVETS